MKPVQNCTGFIFCSFSAVVHLLDGLQSETFIYHKLVFILQSSTPSKTVPSDRHKRCEKVHSAIKLNKLHK